MRYFLADDDPAIRSMLASIIEEEDLGAVAGEAEDGAYVDGRYLAMKGIDVLVIDLLMPLRDGIETVRLLAPAYDGKVVMLSQIESKEMIGAAYALGIEYYITKPINRLEVIGILRRVMEKRKLELSIREIEKSLNSIGIKPGSGSSERSQPVKTIVDTGNFLLSELGLIGEAGCTDLLEMLESLSAHEKTDSSERGFPSLQELFRLTAEAKLGPASGQDALRKEIKASEQRVRRAVNQALNHLASIGLTDYANAKFENYASRFFEFTEVRKKMRDIENGSESAAAPVRLNVKKFVQVFYLEAKRLLEPE